MDVSTGEGQYRSAAIPVCTVLSAQIETLLEFQPAEQCAGRVEASDRLGGHRLLFSDTDWRFGGVSSVNLEERASLGTVSLAHCQLHGGPYFLLDQHENAGPTGARNRLAECLWLVKIC